MKLTVYFESGFWVEAELEHRKRTLKVVSREQREAERERKRELAALKAKAKHRGK